MAKNTSIDIKNSVNNILPTSGFTRLKSENNQLFTINENGKTTFISSPWELPIISMMIDDPSSLSPIDYDRYIVPIGSSGDWAGHGTEIAVYKNLSWEFIVPEEGWAVYNKDDSITYNFDGTAWNNTAGQLDVPVDKVTIDKPLGLAKHSNTPWMMDAWSDDYTEVSNAGIYLDGYRYISRGVSVQGNGDFIGVNFGNSITISAGDYYLYSSIDLMPFNLRFEVTSQNDPGSDILFDSVTYENGLFLHKITLSVDTAIKHLSIDDNSDNEGFFYTLVYKDEYPSSREEAISIYRADKVIGKSGYSIDRFNRKATTPDSELVTRGYVDKTKNNADEITIQKLENTDIVYTTENDIQIIFESALHLGIATINWQLDSQCSVSNGVITINNKSYSKDPNNYSYQVLDTSTYGDPIEFTTNIWMVSNYNFLDIENGTIFLINGNAQPDEITTLPTGEFLYRWKLPYGSAYTFRGIGVYWKKTTDEDDIGTDFPYIKIIDRNYYPTKDVIKIKEIDHIIDDTKESIDGSDTPMSDPHRELVTRAYIEANATNTDDRTIETQESLLTIGNEDDLGLIINNNWMLGQDTSTQWLGGSPANGIIQVINDNYVFLKPTTTDVLYDAGTYKFYTNIKDLTFDIRIYDGSNYSDIYASTYTEHNGLYLYEFTMDGSHYLDSIQVSPVSDFLSFIPVNRYQEESHPEITFLGIDRVIDSDDMSIDKFPERSINPHKEMVTKKYVDTRRADTDEITLNALAKDPEIALATTFTDVFQKAWDENADTSNWNLDASTTFNNGIFSIDITDNTSVKFLDVVSPNTVYFPAGGLYRIISSFDFNTNGIGSSIRTREEANLNIENQTQLESGNFLYEVRFPIGIHLKYWSISNNSGSDITIDLQIVDMDSYPGKNIFKIKEIDHIIDDDNQSIDGSDTPMVNSHKELVTRAYIDNAVNNISSLISVRFIETVFNIDLANPPTQIDYKDVNDGDIICLATQTDAIENGFYQVDSVNGWVRYDPILAGSPVQGVMFTVNEGCLNSDTLWIFTNNTGSDIVGINELYLKQLSADGSVDKNDINIVSAVDEANQFITLSESPISSKHILVNLNGQTLSEGNGLDYEISDKRVIFYVTIEQNDIIDTYYSYIPGGHCIPPIPPSPYFEFDIVIHNAGDNFPMNLIEVPSGGTIDIDWGDGNTQTSGVNLNNITHTYTDIGTYRVKIKGHDWIKFSDGTVYDWDITVKHWGDDTWKSMSGMFSNMTKININTDTPFSTNNNISLQDLFRNSINFNDDISDWDLSNITNIESMFEGCSSFNQNLSTLNINNGLITSLNSIFKDCSLLTYRPNWDTSSITEMSDTFNGATNFNADISTIWNTSNVTIMDRMFKDTSNFNQDISGWDISSVTSCVDFRLNSALECINTPLLPQACTGCFDKFKFDITITANDIFTPNIQSKGDTDLVIDWGDGNIENLGTTYNGVKSHTYTSGGTLNVEVYGHKKFSFYGSGDYPIKVTHWGNNNAWEALDSMFRISNLLIETDDNLAPTTSVNASYMFYGMSNFNSDISSWDTSNFNNTEGMFYNCSSFNQPIGNWNTQNITSFYRMFFGASSFNQPLDGWDVSNVTTMRNTFYGASSFNQDLNSWDVSNVTNTNSLFRDASSFNGNVSSWNTSSVIDMGNTFFGCINFSSDISGWNVSNVTTLDSMFYNCQNFNSDISSWDVSNVTNMKNTFYSCTIFNQPLNSWIVSNVTTLEYTFYYCQNFNQPLNSWDVSNVTNMFGTFRRAHSFNQDLNNWNVSNVTNMKYTFYEATSFNGDISNWNISSCLDCSGMFRAATSFNRDLLWGSSMSSCTTINSMFNGASSFNGDVSNWDVSNVIDMGNTFGGASSFAGDVSSWNTSSCTKMSTMFQSCSNFTTDISSWDVSNVTTMNTMLQGCIHFNAPIGSWNIGNVTDISSMLATCYDFNQDLSNWDTSSVTTTSSTFNRATSFNKDISNWDVSNVSNFSYMFYNASVFNQPLDSWNMINATNLTYMLSGASSFNQDLNSWNVSNVTLFTGIFANATAFNGNISSWNLNSADKTTAMFQSCTSFNQDISAWNTTNITDMSSMFYNANSFAGDISSWDLSNVINTASMFRNTDSFNQDISTWNTANITDMSYMFQDNDAFNQDITSWNVSNVLYCTGFRGGTSVLICANTPALPSSCTGC